jgi:citrate lyase beta subunit
MAQPFRLRRSVLSVPANRDKMIHKSLQQTADVVMLDLEDSVPVAEKEEARSSVARAFLDLDWGGRVRAYRINDMQTPFAYRDLIDVVEAAGRHIDVVVVPKAESAAQLQAADILLSQIEARMEIPHRIGLEAIVETAAGMLQVEEIAFASQRLEALVFGVADYGASLGMQSAGLSGHGEAEGFYPGHRFHFPLSRLAMAAKAAGLQAIDAPYGDFRDGEGLKRSCLLSASLGFDGKWAIHPDQIEAINTTYAPAKEDVERARRILEAYAASSGSGAGSLSLEGKMIDAASIRLARLTCAKWDQMNT